MATPPTTVSVALATFNGASYLREQLESILAQTRLPDEVIISDDHSTDDTVEIVKSYRARAKQLGVVWKVVTNRKPAGVAANFRNALSHCTGELIALSDQDDWWLPNKLAALERHFLGKPSLLMVHSDAQLVDEAGKPLNMRVLESLRITQGEKSNLESGRAIRAVVRRNLVTGSTAMLRRELVDLAGQVPAGWLHDEWWALVAASQGALLLDPEVYQHYRQHGSNEVGATRSGWQRLMERFSEPQELFRSRHRTRHEGLEAYLNSSMWKGTAEANALLRGRFEHYRWQASLPASRIARLGPILVALIRGDYSRYRRGAFDAMRDLLQPAN